MSAPAAAPASDPASTELVAGRPLPPLSPRRAELAEALRLGGLLARFVFLVARPRLPGVRSAPAGLVP